MTGTIVEKKMKSGIPYLYIRLSYKDVRSQKWKQKWLPTGLPAKGNKKQAKAMLPEVLQQYSHLEYKAEDINFAIDRDILFTDYMDLWLSGKKKELEASTLKNTSSQKN